MLKLANAPKVGRTSSAVVGAPETRHELAKAIHSSESWEQFLKNMLEDDDVTSNAIALEVLQSARSLIPALQGYLPSFNSVKDKCELDATNAQAVSCITGISIADLRTLKSYAEQRSGPQFAEAFLNLAAMEVPSFLCGVVGNSIIIKNIMSLFVLLDLS